MVEIRRAAASRTWRTWGQVADLFRLPHDPALQGDLDLLDGVREQRTGGVFVAFVRHRLRQVSVKAVARPEPTAAR